MNVHFNGTDCNVDIRCYSNSRKGVVLVNELGEVITEASVNISLFQPATDEVLISDHGDNEGLLECLTEAGIVQPTGKEVRTGQTEFHICKLISDSPQP